MKLIDNVSEILREDLKSELKGPMSSMQLRLIEDAKIHCAREHFRAISRDNVVYDVVDSYTSLMKKVMK